MEIADTTSLSSVRASEQVKSFSETEKYRNIVFGKRVTFGAARDSSIHMKANTDGTRNAPTFSNNYVATNVVDFIPNGLFCTC